MAIMGRIKQIVNAKRQVGVLADVGRLEEDLVILAEEITEHLEEVVDVEQGHAHEAERRGGGL